jgi:short-subunit dehydrogenase
MSQIRNKKVLITGAAGGLGFEMVNAFLKEGGELILSDLNDSSLQSLVDKLAGSASGKILGTISADLSTEFGCNRLVEGCKRYTDAPDILVNNAGIAVMGPFSSVPKDKWEKILHINLYAPMRLTHAFLPSMINRGSGHIVNISSVAGLVAVPDLATYSVSKFGIKAFGEALQQEVSRLGISVTNLYPFFTRTPILQSEKIGIDKEIKVPDFLLSEPIDVVKDLIRGIKNNEVHVHPGGISKTMDLISRLFPGAIEFFTSIVKR